MAVAVAGCTGGGDDGNSGDTSDNGDDGFEIDPGTTIMLEGSTSGWEGISPDEINGESNPTLIFEAGEAYEMGWEPGDSADHNLELWNEDEELIGDEYATELTSDPDETLEFTASEEMAYYRCQPHSSMQGELRIE